MWNLPYMYLLPLSYDILGVQERHIKKCHNQIIEVDFNRKFDLQNLCHDIEVVVLSSVV